MLPDKVSVCEVCGGFGVVSKNVPYDHPDFGKSFPCPNCKTAALNRRDVVRRMSNLDSYQGKTFDTFQVDLSWLTQAQAASLRIALSQAQQYANHPEGWLLLIGSPGTGKTHLAAAIAQEAVARGEPTIFATSPDLLDHLRATYAPDSEVRYDEQFERLKNVQLLIIDDLGAESPSKWAQEKLYQLLNHRHTAKLATVITTNVEDNRFEERIASRILDIQFTVQIRMNLSDYRRGGNTLNQSDGSVELSDLTRYQHLTFDTFSVPLGDDWLMKNVRRIQRYAQQPEGWLVILGGTGTGKTHLAAAIANHWSPGHGNQAMIISTPDLLDYLRATFATNSSVSLNNRFHEIRNAPLLILDDFGIADKASEWVAQKFFQLIDYRYLSQHPTVITMRPDNQALLEKNHSEIHSRVADTHLASWIVLKNGDFRRSSQPRLD